MQELPDDSTETQRLLNRVRSGDSGAVNRLFAHYRGYLREVIEMRLDAQLRRRIDASDLVQETQLEATRRLKEYIAEEPMPFRLWLRRIARDRLGMAQRRHFEAAQRAMSREIPLSEHSSLQLVDQLLAGGSTPSQHLTKQEEARRIRRALGQLSEADQEILLMRNFEQLTNDEISCVLGIAPAAANMRYVRALVRLSKIFHKDDQTESEA
jgi:RNA polymerase sigma-70 factor (ECF subfamily)